MILQRRADPRLGAADAAAAAQELERVDREEDLHAPRAARARARDGLRQRPAPAAAAFAAAIAIRPRPGAGGAPSRRPSIALRRDAALDQLVARLLGRAHGARDAAGEVDRDDVVRRCSISGS